MAEHEHSDWELVDVDYEAAEDEPPNPNTAPAPPRAPGHHTHHEQARPEPPQLQPQSASAADLPPSYDAAVTLTQGTNLLTLDAGRLKDELSARGITCDTASTDQMYLASVLFPVRAP